MTRTHDDGGAVASEVPNYGSFAVASGEELAAADDAIAEQSLLLADELPIVPIDRVRSNGTTKSKAAAHSPPVSWKDLPRKGQLVVIVLARLAEPLAQTSLMSYLFYQLSWFDPSQSAAEISGKAGILQASFTGAQFLTAMAWGRAADSSRFGRKRVILCGLLGTLISTIGYGFSTTFQQALFFRVLGGITNGNVGVLRTMISETVYEKKYQSRAFLLLPLTFNIGTIIGPMLGGQLADLAGTYPDVFGHMDFFVKYPFAPPNIVSAFILLCGLLSAWLCLEEVCFRIAPCSFCHPGRLTLSEQTLDARLNKRDYGIELGKKLARLFQSSCLNRGEKGGRYSRLEQREFSPGDESTDTINMSPSSSRRSSLDEAPKRRGARYTQRLSFRRIFTRNVVFTLVAHFFLAFHIGSFNSLWPIFLSTPVYDPSHPPKSPDALPRRLPFLFTGGVGLSSRSVGVAMTTLGTIGIALQLVLYPWLSGKLGTMKSWRIFLVCFPVAYFAVPFLSIVPSASPPPHEKSGALVWLALSLVLLCQVLGRTFALPAQTILVNNCSPHPSVLGTVHGIGQTASSAARTIGPYVGGIVYGVGLERGIVGAVWWGLSCVAVCTLVASFWVRDGNGHEVWLEGDEDE
ncbi:hypothetical protein RB600_008769 [Gaeumannomyces tritici]